MDITPKEVREYKSQNGKIPIREWLDSIQEKRTRGIIDIRLERLRRGLLGEWETVGLGVSELKIHYGPGYRIYFAQLDLATVILFCGGDKNSQTRDIQKAFDYWMDYRRRIK